MILDTPFWLEEYFNIWAYRLGVRPFWKARVFVATPEHLDDLNIHATAQAATKQMPHLNAADVYFRNDIHPSPEWEQTVIHELLHILHSRVHTVAVDMLIPAIPEASRKMAEEVWRQADESFIEALAVCLWESYEAGKSNRTVS